MIRATDDPKWQVRGTLWWMVAVSAFLWTMLAIGFLAGWSLHHLSCAI